MIIGQMNERIEQLSKIIDKHEYQLNTQVNGAIKPEELSKSIIHQIR